MNKLHIAVFTSRSFIRSVGLRQYLCLTIEKTFSMCSTKFVVFLKIVWPIIVIAFGFQVSWVSWISWSDEFAGTYWIFKKNSGVPGLLLSLQGSSYPRPELHLFAILEKSTLRLDCNFLRQVSMYFTNLFDKVLWVSPDFSKQSDSAQSKNLSRQMRPRFIVGFDFATILFSPSCSCIRFAIVLVQLVKLKFWAQQTKLKWLMLNRWRSLLQ